MTTKDDLLTTLQRERDTLNEAIASLDRLPIELLGENFPGCTWFRTYGKQFECTLPFDFQLIDKVRKFMQENLPEFQLKRENRYVWDTQKSAGHFLEYETTEDHWSERAMFSIAFRTGHSGTTCVLNQIGTKEVPVYEVICAEGAKETL